MIKFYDFLKLIFVFLLTYFLIYFIHISFFNIKVVFYSALLDAFLAAIVTCFLLFKFFSNSINFSRFESFQLLLIMLLLGYSIAISGPTVIDRSLSFYILEKIRQYGGTIKLEKMDDVLREDFLEEYSVLVARLTEQKRSGTIEIIDECVVLTNKGYNITKFSIFIRKNLLAKERLLGDTYTDKLTNPLEGTVIKEDYKCNKLPEN